MELQTDGGTDVAQRRWAAVDWSDSEHAAVVVNEAGERVAAFKAPHSSEGLEALVARLREFGPLGGIALETTRNVAIHKLLEVGTAVYPLNPKLTHNWRKGYSVAEQKDDFFDAETMACGLQQRWRKLRALQPDDPETRTLALLCQDECTLIRERTALVQRLRATLKQYYPAVLEWFSTWTSPTAWDFVLQFSTPQQLASAKRQRLRGFLKTHRIGLSPLWEERIANRASALDWPGDQATCEAKSLLAVSLVKQLHALNASLKTYRHRIEKRFADHADAALFSSLPGAGKKLAPRLLSHYGADRSRFQSARSVQELSGSAPVTKQSGNTKHVQFRWACQKGFRNTMHHFAGQSLKRSLWARAFYDQAREKGQSNALALRNLACKWHKIIFRMWQQGETYDESVYLASLIRRGSPLLDRIAQLQDGGQPVQK